MDFGIDNFMDRPIMKEWNKMYEKALIEHIDSMSLEEFLEFTGYIKPTHKERLYRAYKALKDTTINKEFFEDVLLFIVFGLMLTTNKIWEFLKSYPTK